MLKQKSTIFILTLFFLLLITLILGIFSTSLPKQNTQTEQTTKTMPISPTIPTKLTSTTQPPQRTPAVVTKVVDGDTLKVRIDGYDETIRIIGIDTPETVDPRKPVQCFGVAASNRAKKLLTGKQIELEKDISQGDRDTYQRLLRYVFIENIDYGLTTIEEGYAHEYTYAVPYVYQAAYKQAQNNAKASKRGLWDENKCP